LCCDPCPKIGVCIIDDLISLLAASALPVHTQLDRPRQGLSSALAWSNQFASSDADLERHSWSVGLSPWTDWMTQYLACSLLLARRWINVSNNNLRSCGQGLTALQARCARTCIKKIYWCNFITNNK
jgi:hypothetical protein